MKTRPTDGSVEAYIAGVDVDRRADCVALVELMSRITGSKPVMWGSSIVGFGSYHYVYESGRQGDWFLVGFAARKANFALYIVAGFDRYQELLTRLGKFKTGKSCLYVKRLADIDVNVLEQLVAASVAHMRPAYV